MWALASFFSERLQVPAFGCYCVEGLFHSTSWTLEFLEGTRTHSKTVNSSICCLYFSPPPLSLISCQSGTDGLCDSFNGCMALTLMESVRTPQLSKEISSSHVLQLTNKHGKHLFSVKKEDFTWLIVGFVCFLFCFFVIAYIA